MTIRAGVIGYPVRHSLSPLIHSYWLGRHGIDACYEALPIAPENLKEGVAELVRGGYAGFNVTLPHKIAVMALCDTIDPVAEAIGAVNTVVIGKQGKLHGRNTDAFGFMANLEEQQPQWRQTPNDYLGPALVLGAGGAARAVVYALAQAGVGEIRICNRSAERAQALAQEGFCEGCACAVAWDKRSEAAAAAGLIVNTTALGMTGQPELDFDLSAAREDAAVYDIVYRPLLTGLLLQAQARGQRTVTGLGMLLHQARPAFAAWFGVMPEVDADLIRLMEEAARA